LRNCRPDDEGAEPDRVGRENIGGIGLAVDALSRQLLS